MLNKLNICKDNTIQKGVIFLFLLPIIILISACNSKTKDTKQEANKVEPQKEKKYP